MNKCKKCGRQLVFDSKDGLCKSCRNKNTTKKETIFTVMLGLGLLALKPALKVLKNVVKL